MKKKAFKAALYLFSLFLINFLLKPLRDQLIVSHALENIQWLFTLSFLATMLFAPIVSFFLMGINIVRLIKFIHVLHALILLLFYHWLNIDPASVNLVIFFFLITNLFNLLFSSLFWAMISELLHKAENSKLVTKIASGASLGALVAPLLVLLLNYLNNTSLLLILAAVTSVSLIFLLNFQTYPTKPKAGDLPVTNMAFLKILSFSLLLYAVISSFLYVFVAFQLNQLQLTAVQLSNIFALRDLGLNLITLGFQLSVTQQIIQKFGIKRGLLAMPLFSIVLFGSLLLTTSIYIIIGFQAFYRAGNLGITKPVREIIFAHFNHKHRISIKHFIDTVIYRTGDMLGAWLFFLLVQVGFSSKDAAIVGLMLSILWIYTNVKTSKLHQSQIKNSKLQQHDYKKIFYKS